jgi:hypothetical protein
MLCAHLNQLKDIFTHLQIKFGIGFVTLLIDNKISHEKENSHRASFKR